ncbi:MAG: hypothetical protein HeimC3_42960, partial [Candidatus Heimdallarchaeota archaeon LC_3]
YNSLINQNKKMKLKNLNEMTTEINKFIDFCHLYNIYSIDEENTLRKQKIRDHIKILRK